MNDYGSQRLWGSVHVEVDGATTADRVDALSCEIEKALYRKYRAILHTVSVYSSNAQDEADPAVKRMRADIERIVCARRGDRDARAFREPGDEGHQFRH